MQPRSGKNPRPLRASSGLPFCEDLAFRGFLLLFHPRSPLPSLIPRSRMPARRADEDYPPTLSPRGPHQALGRGEGSCDSPVSGLCPLLLDPESVALFSARPWINFLTHSPSERRAGTWMPPLGGLGAWPRSPQEIPSHEAFTPYKNQGDNRSPPTCCREMKGFAESFELGGVTHPRTRKCDYPVIQKPLSSVFTTPASGRLYAWGV